MGALSDAGQILLASGARLARRACRSAAENDEELVVWPNDIAFPNGEGRPYGRRRRVHGGWLGVPS